MKNNKRDIIILALSIPLIILSSIYTDFLVTFIILMISIFLFVYSYGSKFKFLLRTFSVFIFLHLIFFPWLYVSIIKIDSNSFKIDSEIESNEISQFEKEITKKFNPDGLINDQQIITKILSSHNSYLDSTFNSINNNNVLYLDSFILHKTAFHRKMHRPSGGFASIAICDIKGNNLTNIIGYEENLDFPLDITIGEYLSKRSTSIQKDYQKFNTENLKKQSKETWNYRRLLSYSINIFDTDNFNPKRRLSNGIYFVHKFIVVVLIFGLIGAAFYDMLKKKNEN